MSSPCLHTKLHVARSLLLTGLLCSALVLTGCDPREQRAVQTAAASVAETAVAAGKAEAGTQIARAKGTGVAAAATKAASVMETTVAGAATKAVELKETAEAGVRTRVAPQPSGVSAEVQAARVQLAAMPEMQCHWKQVQAPLQNAPGSRNAVRYADVIDQFEVTSSQLAGRYVAGGCGQPDTRCNIFAGDVMRAMGAPLPTKGNLGLGQGDRDAKFSDPMTATAIMLNKYLNQEYKWVTSEADPGVPSDWTEVAPTTKEGLERLIAHVNAGKPAIVSDPEHVAVMRPGQAPVQDWRDLVIAQAGSKNFLIVPLRDRFDGTPQFFIHN